MATKKTVQHKRGRQGASSKAALCGGSGPVQYQWYAVTCKKCLAHTKP